MYGDFLVRRPLYAGRAPPPIEPSSRGRRNNDDVTESDCRAALIVLAASRGWSQAPQHGPAPAVTRAASKNWDPCGNCGHFGRSQSSFRRRHATQVKSSPVGSSTAENSASQRRRARPAHRRVAAQPLGVVHVLVVGQPTCLTASKAARFVWRCQTLSSIVIYPPTRDLPLP